MRLLVTLVLLFLVGYALWRLFGAALRSGAAGPATVEFDHEGIGARDRRGEAHQVRWREISRIEVRTDGGAATWYVYAGEDEPRLAFPGDARGAPRVLAAMQERLSDFRSDQVVAAQGAAEARRYVVWERAGRA